MGLAPAEPAMSDRNDYDYNAQHWLTAYCRNSIMCYRILVPVLLDHVPMDAEPRWRAYQWLAHTATGSIVAMTMQPVATPMMTSVLVQSCYALAYTAYDPFTPDPFVFLVAALTLYLWFQDRVLAMTLLVAVGVFAKETVAVIAAAPAIAVLFSDRPRRWRWWIPLAVALTVLLSFHWYMDTYAGWSVRNNPSSNVFTGSWFVIWLKNNPSTVGKALLLFSPFAFGWVFAAAGYRHAPLALRQLALGAIVPIAALTYVQTPERALGNAFFVVIPLAASFLAQLPPAAAWAAVITTALVTMRIGLSSESLPSTTILLIPATLAFAWAFTSYFRNRDKIAGTR